MLRPGTLWSKTLEASERALGSGALRPISTKSEFVLDGGVNFIVRTVSNLALKQQAKKKREQEEVEKEQKTNPFLPYEEALLVSDISPTHVCLLNKFNVIDHHLLIVTRRFEDQEMLLTKRDFEALWVCLGEVDGLGFYNGGEIAGASERHKHLQMIPLPMGRPGPRVPIEAVLDNAGFNARLGRVSGLPFGHAFARIEFGAGAAAENAYRLYRAMLDSVGLNRSGLPGDVAQSGPYNLLLTRRWMLLVPRVEEFFGAISVNALGFAGALLAKNDQELQTLTQQGPMAVLKHTAAGMN
ncbi:MAG: phosphorylase [Proteobacteria bacterium]|nr:phosphorylase [Pseudomonadota bacterium]